MRLLAVSILATTAFVSPVFAESGDYTQGTQYQYQSPEALKFQTSILETSAKGYDAPSIVQAFQINGWGIDESTVNAIISGTMTGQEALDAGLIAPFSSESETENTNGETQYGGSTGGGSNYTGGSISLGSIPGATCAGGQAASGAAGAAGAIWSWFGGGDATALLQVAQQIQLYSANACLFAQLQAQLRGLWMQVENLRNLDFSSIQATMNSLYRVRSLLGSVDSTTYMMNRVTGMMQANYPDTYDAMTTDEEVMNQSIIWEDASKKATEESWRIQAAIIEHQKQVEERTAGQVQSLNEAPGMLAAQQATGNLITTMIEQAAKMESATVAHYRVMEHKVMSDQAAKQNAEELHKRRSEGWGYMGETEVFEPFAN
jgi:P-type conjugative transfer protein TrbJ